MSKTALSVLILGTCIAGSATAGNIFQKLTAYNKHQNVVKSLTVKPASGDERYVDFSGTWEGSCTGYDDTDIIHIENTAYYLDADGLSIGIGVLTSNTTNGELGASFDHLLLNWSTDRTSLLGEGIFGFVPFPSETSSLNSGSFKFSMSLQEGKLIVKAKSSDDPDTDICTYHRVK